MSQPEAKLAKRVWQKTPTANLVRYVARGTYYARARVGGKFHRQSLKTTVLTVARLRLGDVVKEWRATSSRRRAVTDGVGGLGEALNLVRERRTNRNATDPRGSNQLLQPWPKPCRSSRVKSSP